jgi:hypothetical protein
MVSILTASLNNQLQSGFSGIIYRLSPFRDVFFQVAGILYHVRAQKAQGETVLPVTGREFYIPKEE